jgi:ribosomal protein S18 acetylase RimI-like enzyme
MQEEKWIIREAVKEDIALIVAIHETAFPSFLMTHLGPKFLSVYYQAVLDYDGGIMLVISDHFENVLGFVGGVVQPDGFYRLFGRGKRNAIGAAFLYVFSRPGIWLRVLDNMRQVGKRSSLDQSFKRSAELASIAVDPRSNGRGLGRALVKSFLKIALAKGVDVVTLSTDADDNEKVRRFYEQLGFIVSRNLEKKCGRRMSEYLFRIHSEGETQ